MSGPERPYKRRTKTISIEREVPLDEHEIDKVLDAAAGVALSINACIRMELLRHVLLNRKRLHFGRLDVSKGEEIRATDGFRLPRKRTGKADVHGHLLEYSTGELRPNAVAHGATFLVLRDLASLLDRKCEEVAEIERLSRDQVGRGGLLRVVSHEVHILGGAGSIPEPEVECEGPLEHTSVGSGHGETSQETIEDDGLP